MRALLSPIGSRGDVQPSLALGLELVRRGYEVLFCAPPEFDHWVSARGLTFRPVGVNITRAIELVYEEGGGLRAVTKWVAKILEDQFRDLQAQGADFDVIVGAGLQCAGPALAERLGIPYVYEAHCPNFLRSSHHAPVFFSPQRLPAVLNRLLWGVYVRVGNATVLRALNRARALYELPPVSDGYRFIFEQSHVLLSTDPSLGSRPPDLGPHVRQTGFWFLDDPTPLPEPLVTFIESGTQPVFIGFGSMPVPEPGPLARTIARTATLTGHRFVVGSGGVGDVMRELLPESCFVVDTVDYGKLFSRMAAIVHHGGAGTTALAAHKGVPQVVVPHVADQFYWGHQVATTGIGSTPLRFSRLRAGPLARRIDHVTMNADVAHAARTLAETMKTRRGVETAADIIEHIISE